MNRFQRATQELVYVAGQELGAGCGVGRVNVDAPAILTTRDTDTYAAGEAAGPPEKVLADIADVGGLVPAVVTSVDASTAVAWARGVGPVELAVEWAAPYIDEYRRGDAHKGATSQALQRNRLPSDMAV